MPSRTRKMIEQALTRSGRHAKKAENLIKRQLQKEPELIYDLVAPFLNGIIAHAVRRAQKGLPVGKAARPMKKVRRKAASQESQGLVEPGNIPNKSMASILGQLEKNVGQAAQESKKGLPRGRKSGDEKTSRKHQDAIYKLAQGGFYKGKK